MRCQVIFAKEWAVVIRKRLALTSAWTMTTFMKFGSAKNIKKNLSNLKAKWLSMSEKSERKTITVKITLPTEKDIVEALSKLFPGVKVEVEKAEKPSESVVEEKTTEEA